VNPQLFPLSTTSYPFTRQIQAEIGSIIAIWLFGVVANWQWFKFNRKKNAHAMEEKKRNEDELKREEEEAGMQATLAMTHEMPLWEKAYGQAKTSVMSISEKSLGRQSSISSIPERRNTLERIENDAKVPTTVVRQPTTGVFNPITGIIEHRPVSRMSKPPMVSRRSSERLSSPIRPSTAPQMRNLNMPVSPPTNSKILPLSPPKRDSKRVPNITIQEVEEDAISAPSPLVVLRNNTKPASEVKDATAGASIMEEKLLDDSAVGSPPPVPERSMSRLRSSSAEKPSDSMLPSENKAKSEKNVLPDNVTSQLPEGALDEAQDLLKPLPTSTRSSWNKSPGTNRSSINNNIGRGTIGAISTSPPSTSPDSGSPVRSPLRSNSRNSASPPMLGQLCESPIEDEAQNTTEATTPLPQKSGTLMGQREHKLKSKAANTPFSNFTRSSSSLADYRSPSTEPRSGSDSPVNAGSTDINGQSQRQKPTRTQTTPDLAQRRSSSRNNLAQRSSSQQSLLQNPGQLKRRMSDSATVQLNDPLRSGSRLSQNGLNNKFDSHQPRRPEDAPKVQDAALRLAQWRVSLNNDPKRTSFAPTSMDNAREQLLIEKRNIEQAKQQQHLMKQQGGYMTEEAMRSQGGIALHARRMSALQAKVKMDSAK
jgi:hypothetical protein